jgi:DNA-directed RNA polymerase specialized sigma24 family protein
MADNLPVVDDAKVAEIYRMLWKVTAQTTWPADRADDARHEIMRRILQQIRNGLWNEQAAELWCRKSVLRRRFQQAAIDAHRRDFRKRDPADDMDQFADRSDSAIELAEETRKFRSLLDTDDERQLFDLLLECPTKQENAAELGITLPKFYARVFHLRSKLRLQLGLESSPRILRRVRTS